MGSRRPPNRKALIRSAAGELFLERGYHNVSVTDVAEALDIAPSALYHHYRNKQDLLLHAVMEAFESVDVLVREASDLDEALRALARIVVTGRRSLAFWEREARNLDEEQRASIREGEAEVVGHVAPLLTSARPDLDDADALLISRAVFGVMGSRAQHRAKLPRRKDEEFMTHLGWLLAECRLPTRAHEAEPTASSFGLRRAGLRPARRDVLLAEAVRLFDERGYQSVTMADIGEAAGIVASGVYRHFSSKTDILVAATNRGGDRLRASVDRAVTLARDPEETLTTLLDGHIEVALEHQHLIGILTNEADQLPDADRRALRRFQHDYLDVWIQALQAVLGEDHDVTELKIVVHAVQAMIFFVARRAGDGAEANLDERLRTLGLTLLLGAWPDTAGRGASTEGGVSLDSVV